ncbi:ankyrin repeat-containing domain protein [Aspergillus egyptiacus]|nr:ankyrin repeat-containing domain protein [Aspergillus egyptiacus]
MRPSQNLFHSLPEELILEVAKYLSGESLQSFAHTSRDNFRIAKEFVDREHVWHKGLFGKSTPEAVYVWLSRDARYPTAYGIKQHPVGVDAAILKDYTQLLSACMAGDSEEARNLLERGVSPNRPRDEYPSVLNDSCFTPLEAVTMYCRRNQVEIVQMLVAAGVDLHLDFRETYRVLCHGNLHPEAAEVLIHAGLNPNPAGGSNGDSLLHYSCRVGSPLVAVELLSALGHELDRRNLFGDTPLAVAINCVGDGNTEERQAVIAWLAQRALANTPCMNQGQLPLHRAVALKRLEIIRLLLSLGEFSANVNGRDGMNRTPLAIIIPYITGYPEIVETLLFAGADITAMSVCQGREMNALQLAVHHASPVLSLIYRAWLDTRGLDRPRVLFVAAAMEGDIRMLKRLSSFCLSDQDDAEYDESMALSKAARCRKPASVDFLLSLPNMSYSYDVLLEALVRARTAPEKTILGILARMPPTVRLCSHWKTVLEHGAGSYSHPVMSILLDRVRDSISVSGLVDLLFGPARKGNLETLTLLLQMIQSRISTTDGSRAPIPGIDGYSPLMVAARHGHVSIVKALIEEWGLNIEDKTIHNCSVLSMAVQNNHPDLVLYLLSAGADINAPIVPDAEFRSSARKVDRDPETLILHATRKGFADVVAVLLRHGIDAGAVDEKSGRTLLSWAAGEGHVDTARVILSHMDRDGISHVDRQGRSALSWAAANGHAATVALLIQEGAEIDVRDDDNRTPLQLAIISDAAVPSRVKYDYPDMTEQDLRDRFSRRCEVARVLLKNGADGASALLDAVYFHQAPMVELLISYGVDFEKESPVGVTALSRACELRAHDVAQVLVSAGCDASRTDGLGRNPLQYAEDDARMIRILYSGRS